MIQTSGVSRDRLKFERRHIFNDFRIMVHDPQTNKALGFLLYNGKRGMLELCNYDGKLGVESLALGHSTKRHNDNSAGTHGEGSKVAALVMIRNGHQAKFVANGFYWTFGFEKDEKVLSCNLSKVNGRNLQQESNPRYQESSQFRPASPKNDVSVRLGNVYGKKEKSISEAEVMQWLKVCLHFERPKNAIHTRSGTLILEEEFSGKFYFQGFLLEGMSTWNFRYGYDFSQSNVGLDRNAIGNSEDLAQLLSNVWEGAVGCNSAKSIDKYIDMLLDQKKDWMDVYRISEKMGKPLAQAIWNRLQEKNTGGNIFYYGQGNTAKVWV